MSTNEAGPEPLDASSEIAELADLLGPACRRLMARPAVHEAVHQRIREGRRVDDAVLAEIHARAADDRQLADEFAAYFLYDLYKLGKHSMSSTSRLRRFLDTGDLVHSVLGDMWPDLARIRFESRSQFKALLAQRLNWKAADQARRLGSASRREDLRVAERPEELDLTAHEEGAAPLPTAIRNEERARLILILLRLEPRDRQVVTLALQGESIDAIATTLGLNYDAARKALSRAVQRARELAAASDRHHRAAV